MKYAMHPIQDLFLEGFSYVLQIDMHFICTPMWARFYFFVKSGCYNMEISSHRNLWVKICRRLLSCFMKSLLLHVPTREMPNLLDTYNTYIGYIEEASFCGLTMRSSALERHPTR
jgi:hypothetical protein